MPASKFRINGRGSYEWEIIITMRSSYRRKLGARGTSSIVMGEPTYSQKNNFKFSGTEKTPPGQCGK
jgi:hypothetical protein